jgi:hypothetical protein
MATLAVDTPRDYGLGDIVEYPVIASDIIYEGAAVGENASGYSRPLVAGDVFQGFCMRQADNSSGAAGDINVLCRSRGYIVLALTAIAITANDLPPVYASDDGTFTLTVGSNSPIGNVARWISTGYALVYFDVARRPSTVATADIAGDAVTAAKIADAQISLEHLDAAITPTHVPLYGGQITTGGGAAAEAETISGIAATDLAIVTMVDDGTNDVTLLFAVCTTNTLTVTFSGDPGADAIYNYLIFRAAA